MPEDEEIKSLKELINKQLKNCDSLNYKKLKAAGIDSTDHVTREIFTSRVPFTTKSEIVTDHTNNKPFGSNLVKDQNQYPKLKEVMLEWYNNNKLNHKIQKLPMGRKKKLEG